MLCYTSKNRHFIFFRTECFNAVKGEKMHVLDSSSRFV